MYEYRAKLSRVVDGDTYDLEIDLGLRVLTRARVRLRGVDTPETYGVRAGSAEWTRGQAAKSFVLEWFERHGPELIVHTFRDRTGKFGRWLVEIEDTGRNVRLSEDLLASGHAVVMDGRVAELASQEAWALAEQGLAWPEMARRLRIQL